MTRKYTDMVALEKAVKRRKPSPMDSTDAAKTSDGRGRLEGDDKNGLKRGLERTGRNHINIRGAVGIQPLLYRRASGGRGVRL